MEQRRRRPRALTLTLPDAQRPFLVYEGKKYTLRNFSEEGIGLWLPPPPPYGMNKGMKINGDLLIDNEIFPIVLHVVDFYPRCVGMRILHKSPELTQLFAKLLEPTTYAGTLTVRPESGQEDRTNGCVRLWMTGCEDTELVVWYNTQRMVIALQVCWLGKWIFREQLRPVQTGVLREDRRLRNGTRVVADDLLLNHPEPDAELLQQAAQFLTSVALPIPGYLLWQFLETGEQISIPPLTEAPSIEVA